MSYSYFAARDEAERRPRTRGSAEQPTVGLSRRSSILEVPCLAGKHDGPIHLVIDSTGLKILGGGEWHAYKHRGSNKRRSWRKLHLAVGNTLLDSGADETEVCEALLMKIAVPVASFRGDGAYDTRAFYAARGMAGMPDIDIVIAGRRSDLWTRGDPERRPARLWR